MSSRPQITSPVIFEGNQGVLLDENLGTAPHNTWTDCTFRHAESLAREWGLETTKVGIMWTYSTRHGAGPFVVGSTDPVFHFPDHNHHTRSLAGEFRQGPFDLVAARYAVRVSQPDCLAVTHLDRMYAGEHRSWKVCTGYTVDGLAIPEPDFTNSGMLGLCEPEFTDWHPATFRPNLQSELEIPIQFSSHGPTWQDFTAHSR